MTVRIVLSLDNYPRGRYSKELGDKIIILLRDSLRCIWSDSESMGISLISWPALVWRIGNSDLEGIIREWKRAIIGQYMSNRPNIDPDDFPLDLLIKHSKTMINVKDTTFGKVEAEYSLY